MRPPSVAFLSRSSVRSLLAMALMGLLAWPAVAVAQSQPSLAEIARQEAERRKTIKDAKKVITAKDLPESARRPVSAPATAQGGAAAPASQASPSGPSGSEQKPAPGGDTAPSGQQDEAAWRGRITRAREALARSEAFLAAFQSQVNGLTADFANASDAYSRARVDEDRQKALAQMERVKADIELSKKQIADIEEDARKAGVPPGWLR